VDGERTERSCKRIPDVSLDLFYRRLEGTNQHAFDVGVAIPLPLFNRNQGNVRSALAEQLAASARVRATRNELVRDLRVTHTRLALLLQSVRIMREELLSQADTVLTSVEARFESGDASQVEVLPVRRDWTGTQLGYINALRRSWSPGVTCRFSRRLRPLHRGHDAPPSSTTGSTITPSGKTKSPEARSARCGSRSSRP
tara:strand:+ start:2699 stop:3295 length:597 start_codon:yes stop_codon:yes gene_type:complete